MIDFVRRLGLFLVLGIAQALVCNHISLFGCATPFVYIYMILAFPLNYPRWAMMLWSFALGLAVDVFANTPGVASASLTLLAAIHPFYLRLLVSQDAPENVTASFRDIGTTKTLFYSLTCSLFYCLVFFSLEMFSFFNWQQWLLNILGSTLLSFVIIIAIASINRK